MDRFSRSLWMVTVLAVAPFVPAAAVAQSIWVDPGLERAVWLEVLHPDFDEADGVDFITSSLFLGGRVPTGTAGLSVVAEVPFSYASLDLGEGGDDTDATIGNPYLGIEYRRGTSPLSFELGARAPLASDENFGTLTGLSSDNVARAEAFVPDLLPITGWVNYRLEPGPGLAIRLRGGPSMWIPTEGGDVELVAGLSGQLWYLGNRVSVGGGYVGRGLVTEAGSFDERTAHQVGASANVTLGRFVPGVQLRVPLEEDEGESLDYVVGLGLGMKLR